MATWSEAELHMSQGYRCRLDWWYPDTYVMLDEDTGKYVYDDGEEFTVAEYEKRFTRWVLMEEKEDDYGKDPRIEWAEMFEDEWRI